VSHPHDSADIDPEILSKIAQIDDAVAKARAAMDQLVRRHQANLQAGRTSGTLALSPPEAIRNGYFYDIRIRAADLRDRVEVWLRGMAHETKPLDRAYNRRIYNHYYDEAERIIIDANALIEYANTGAAYDALAFARMDEACKQLTYRLGLSNVWPEPAIAIRLVHQRFPPPYQTAVAMYQRFNAQYSQDVSVFHAHIRPELREKLKELQSIDMVGYMAATRRANCNGICSNIGVCMTYGCCIGAEVLWPEQYWKANISGPSSLQRWWWRTKGKLRGSC
jgi:hypothetical protein